MSRFAYAWAALAALAAGSAWAQLGGPPAPDPAAILAEAKAASGGAAWDALRSQHSKVSILTGPITGSAERWSEFTTGRSTIVYTIGPVAGAAGFDGKSAWTQDESGKSQVETGEAPRELALNAAYRDRLAFWYPDRAAAHIAYKERAEADGAFFHVIRITPEGGRPFELWINTETKLIERLVEREAQATRTEVYMDMRDVQGVKVPFRVRASRGEGRRDEVVTVDTMEFNAPLDGVRFAQPAPPAPDFAFPPGRTLVEAPLEAAGGHVFVKVMLNGRGPVRMLLDSSGHNVLSVRAAALAGARTDASGVGTTRVDRIELSGLVLERQAFAIVDLDEFLARVEGMSDIGGVLGYEVFTRMPVKLDYGHSRAVLYDPAKFRYAGSGVRVPLVESPQGALTQGEVDGVSGLFEIDTGSRGSLTLGRAFAEEHGLADKYGAGVEAVYGASVAGPVRAALARAKSLVIGEVLVNDPVTAVPIADGGRLSATDASGIVGNGILSKFDVTFDVPGNAIYFEKNASYAKPDVYDRAGMWIERGERGFEVVDVVAGGPAAAAGIKPGDVIVAIDGKPWNAVALAAVRSELRGAAGREVRLRLAGGAARVIKLRDLI